MSLASQVESCYCIRYLVQTELSLCLVEQATTIAEDNLVVIRIYIVEWTWILVGIDVLAHSVVGQRHVVVSVTVGCPAAEVTTSVSGDVLA